MAQDILKRTLKEGYRLVAVLMHCHGELLRESELRGRREDPSELELGLDLDESTLCRLDEVVRIMEISRILEAVFLTHLAHLLRRLCVQVEAERAEIRMPEGPIGEIGEYPIGVHLHSEVNAEVLVRVVGQGGEAAAVVATEVVDEVVAEEISGEAVEEAEVAEDGDAPEASQEATKE